MLFCTKYNRLNTSECFYDNHFFFPFAPTSGQVSKHGVIHLVRTQNIRKTSISYPLIRRATYAYRGKEGGNFCVRT